MATRVPHIFIDGVEHKSTLEKKCTLISMFDAIAYQCPHILQTNNLDTPLDLIRLMLEGKGSHWDVCETTKSLKQSMIEGTAGYGIVFPHTCQYLDINMCAAGLPSFSSRAKHCLSHINDSSHPKILNIHIDGPKHVEFTPFPYVRTKRDQELYETYSDNSRVQIKKFERKKFWEEETKTCDDMFAMGDIDDGGLLWEAFVADMGSDFCDCD